MGLGGPKKGILRAAGNGMDVGFAGLREGLAEDPARLDGPLIVVGPDKHQGTVRGRLSRKKAG